MATNFVQNGHYLTLPAAPYALDPGDGALVGSIFGVSMNESASGAECVLGVTGVYSLLKVTTDVIAIGDDLYWDDSVKAVTVTATANTRIGVAVSAAGNPSTAVNVRLTGP
jgi:predicted RecA/RadA family phage recombinase